jgi:two-component system NtrC family sensor kinase
MSTDEKVKILCVDDEKNVLRALERLFFDHEYEIITAMSGEEGLDLLKKEDLIQVIISDYRMPGMNGVDFLKSVYEEWPQTVRIVLSGYADTASIVEAINEGQIYKFIPKPWNDDDLKVTISNAVDFYFMQQRNVQLARELEMKNEKLQEINDNLEHIVRKRTSDLEMHNKILKASQNILNSLPIAVIGVDSEGVIVQCNRKGEDIFGSEDISVVGMDRGSLFPDDMNNIIEMLAGEDFCSGQIFRNGADFRVKAVNMKNFNGQEGVILVVDEGTSNGK